MSAWQTIDTAPKDGTRIIGFDDSGVSIIEYWEPDAVALSDGCTAGWISHTSDGDEYTTEPTHWMPLPEPPVKP